jgi:hypothetical protein
VITTVCFMCMIFLNSHRVYSFLSLNSSQLTSLQLQGLIVLYFVMFSKFQFCKAFCKVWLFHGICMFSSFKKEFWDLYQFEVNKVWALQWRWQGLFLKRVMTEVLLTFTFNLWNTSLSVWRPNYPKRSYIFYLWILLHIHIESALSSGVAIVHVLGWTPI